MTRSPNEASACAQSDQCLCCPQEETLHPYITKMRPVKILIGLDCTNAQADLSLRWAHMSEGTLSDVLSHFILQKFNAVLNSLTLLFSVSHTRKEVCLPMTKGVYVICELKTPFPKRRNKKNQNKRQSIF